MKKSTPLRQDIEVIKEEKTINDKEIESLNKTFDNPRTSFSNNNLRGFDNLLKKKQTFVIQEK